MPRPWRWFREGKSCQRRRRRCRTPENQVHLWMTMTTMMTMTEMTMTEMTMVVVIQKMPLYVALAVVLWTIWWWCRCWCRWSGFLKVEHWLWCGKLSCCQWWSCWQWQWQRWLWSWWWSWLILWSWKHCCQPQQTQLHRQHNRCRQEARSRSRIVGWPDIDIGLW